MREEGRLVRGWLKLSPKEREEMEREGEKGSKRELKSTVKVTEVALVGISSWEETITFVGWCNNNFSLSGILFNNIVRRSLKQ